MLSIREIMDEIEANDEVATEKAKADITLLYRQARWITIGVNNPKKFPALKDEFPELFTEDPEEAEPEKKKKKGKARKMEKWEIEKAQMAIYAEAFNRNRKEINE